jgi:hypothetical protein
VLTDDGPLGEEVRRLAATYLPQLAERQRKSGLSGLFGGLKRALVSES